jgi:hypothetical protein
VRLAESVLAYELTVLDFLGKPVPRTEYGTQIEEAQRNGPSLQSVAVFDLPPGQEYTSSLGLRMRFKIEAGQDYTVKVRRWDRSAWSIDESDKRVALRELSRTLKGIGHASIH